MEDEQRCFIELTSKSEKDAYEIQNLMFYTSFLNIHAHIHEHKHAGPYKSSFGF